MSDDNNDNDSDQLVLDVNSTANDDIYDNNHYETDDPHADNGYNYSNEDFKWKEKHCLL